jgi:hypothetical protein
LQASSPSFNGLFPVHVTGIIPAGLAGLVTPMKVGVTNLTGTTQRGVITISLTNSNGINVTNLSQLYSVAGFASQVITFSLPANLLPGAYALGGFLNVPGGQQNVLSGIYQVSQERVRPSLTITTPKSNQKVDAPLFTIQGTAKGRHSISSIWYQLNSNGWALASGTANWDSAVMVSPGTNIVQAYAVDANGNTSPTSTVRFFYATPSILTVTVSGNGGIVPSRNGQSLNVGQSYTLSAVPNHGFLFSNWSGSISSTANPLSFLMQSNMDLQATFVPNPFNAVQGAYNGLFMVTNDLRQQTNSGGFSFNLTTSGKFTGTLLCGSNKPLTLTGAFNVGGTAEVLMKLTAQNSLTTDLQLDFANQTVSGTVSDGSFVAQLGGYRNVFGSANPANEYEGKYTMVILGTNDPSVGPYGISYGTVTVSSSGVVTFGGNLADGAAGLSQSTAISQTGYWPLYLQLYGGKGSLWAWTSISNHQITASASWINATNSSKSAVYRGGFTNQDAAVIGSWYSSTNKPLFGFTNGAVMLEEAGGSPFTLTNDVVISPSDVITVEKTNKLGLKINTTTGVITGTFANPLNPKQTISLNGVLLQGQTSAEGYFLGTNQSGTFLLIQQ